MKLNLSTLFAGITLSFAAQAEAPVAINPGALAAFAPLPDHMAKSDAEISPEKIALGRQLFFDARLSKNHDVSCNSCHGLDTFGVDGKPTSTGHKGQLGGRNSPTVYNAGGHFSQFWDGRAADLKAQAKGPILNPIEMALPDEAAALAVVNSMPEYVAAFKKAFPKGEAVTYDNLAEAIAAFERKLVTPSRFDALLKGQKDALSPAEIRGLNTFVSSGCNACHSGAYLGGHMFQKLGLVKPWPNQKDQGRFDLTKKAGDKMFFKVPSLRNIAKTAPYFHDGSVASLDTAVGMMAEHQLGTKLTPAQIKDIVVFLGALTGTVPADYIAKPKLPASTASTPKANPN